MEDRSSRLMLLNALLGNVTLDPANTPSLAGSDAENEALLAQVLRQEGERLLRGEFGRSEYVPLSGAPPQTFGGTPMGSALWPSLPLGADPGSVRAPSSPRFLPPDASSGSAAPYGLSRFGSEFAPPHPAAPTSLRTVQSMERAAPSLLGDAIPSEQPVRVSQRDTTRARPWWDPPGVFDPWAEHFVRGIRGLLDFRSRAPAAAGDPNAPGCKEEWDHARETCIGWLTSPDPPRNASGGYKSLEDCARGLVSERCGGNPVDFGRPKRRR
jgi:hypothetical protein